MSTITFTCYACNQVLKVGADKAGKKAKCIKCGTILTIPMETPEAPPEEMEEEAAPTPAKGKGRAADDDLDDDRPRRRPRDDDDEDEAPRSKRRRDDDDEDDQPRSKRRRDDDDEDDEPRSKRGRDDEDDEDDGRSRRGGGSAGGGIFERQGLNMMGTVFMFVGVGLLVLLLITVFFPWRKPIPPPEAGANPFVDAMVGALSKSGITTIYGIFSLIMAIVGAAFVMVAVFVLSPSLFKISLWSAFGCSLVGGILGLLGAILKSTEGGGTTKTPLGDMKGPELTFGGAWGAWIAMVVGIIAAAMFIITVFTLQSVGGGKRRAARDDDDDDDGSRSRRDDDDEDDDRGAKARKSARDDDDEEEPRPKKRRPRDDDDD